jgi:toxin-antitoxin system PIN domain toxin
VLIALLDPDHTMHAVARTWLASRGKDGWATCPITENGFVRIVSQPGYPNPVTVREGIAALRAIAAVESHEFWPCDVSLSAPDTVDTGRLIGSGQVTDAYLLALAKHQGGCLATFDRRIAAELVPGATPAHLVVIGT